MPLPEVTGFSDERVRLLAAICYEMQRLVGVNSFFLPTRKLGRLLGAHWSSVARWLVALDTLGVIHLAPGEVRSRGGNRCPRYHYGKPVQQTPATAVAKSVTSMKPVRLENASDGNNEEDTNHGGSNELSAARAVVAEWLTRCRTASSIQG
jgi:hypothetical protein